MTNHTASLTLVTGGTGKTGRRVAARLQELGVPVRIGSRAADPAFDWAEPTTWDAALDGARAAYIAFQPDLAVPGADDVIRAFTARATAAGVQRLVLLSGRGEPEAEACERVVLSAGVDATVVRASWFLQNFSESAFLPGVLAGELALPVAPDIAEPFVDADDIADVAVAALTQDGHAGEIYEVTGPRALTFPEVLAEIGRATGREIRYQPLTIEQFTDALTAEGVSQDELSLFTYLFTEVLDGRNAATADGVQRALGRAPRDAKSWASGPIGVVTTA
ncbi:NmrA family transcriptional regulator [Svornostia abyssi]|uniref:NmrA family transcriptional regulator n=1 Tax=Svornostia abyssi TaxID=2898438 RepID=A0ABY5PJX8_9ACTN|nr:NmrA family transcriptional regulator [Parviterribacteraceae bacterium J379]